MTNRKLGKYEIIERLGRGGMAEVYKAYHASLDRYVAIKILHAFLADDEEFAARFGREAQNIARLKHPHIVQVYDYEYDANSESYYMIMELIAGDTLKDRLLALEAVNKRMPLEEALRITREAATALAYAHKNGMIHRDVKPANLLIDNTENDRVVLTDFGIAKIVKGSQMTVSGGLVGTPAYMAPEQGIGETGDERSDLYSLGIILYQMITGELPYDAETPLALILRHMNDPIPSARALDANIPQPIERIARKLMAKEPDNRYRSAEELITDIRRVENNLHQAPIDDNTPVQLTAIDLTSYSDAHLDSPTIPFNRLGVRKKDETQRIPPITRTQPLTMPNQSKGNRWVFGVLALIVLLFMMGGGYLLGVQSGTFPAISFLASPTPTYTETAVLTVTSSATSTLEPTETSTHTPTVELTTTEASGLAVTDESITTATHTPTATLEPTHTSTAETPTVTPNATQTQSAIRTATASACQFDYAIIDQQPPEGADGGFFTVNSRYIRRITLINTGTCAWERNTSMTFVEGEDFNAGPRVFIRSEVEVGEEIELVFEATLPSVGSLEPISGTWQLRTPGQIPIGKPLTISVRVYDPGTGGS